MSEKSKLTLINLIDLLKDKKYPIIHYSSRLSECDFCCPINAELLTQCKHYLIVTSYDAKSDYVIVRMITHSPRFGNLKPNDNQFTVFNKYIEVDYYTKDNFILSYECLKETYLFGYFNYL